MKKTPLKRKTPLRAWTELKSSAEWKPQKVMLKRRSTKMQRLYDEKRVPLVRELLANHPACSARLQGCSRRATEVHEMKTRARGGSITDRGNCVTLCRSCHSWITNHPRQAKELGWLKSAWDQ